MKIECISISSSEDGDNHDAELLDTEGDHYTSLCQLAWVQCEFCDRIFNNRFSLIQHNASHIIIPLIKQTHQCTTCLRHFTTEDDLNVHISETHEKTPTKSDILQSIVKKEVLVQCQDDFKDVFVNKNIIGTIIPNKNVFSEDRDSPQSRLLFEEDDDDIISFNDLSKNSSVPPISLLSNPISSFNKPISQFNNPINSFNNSNSPFNNLINLFNKPVSSFNNSINNPITSFNDSISSFKNPSSSFNHPVRSFHNPISSCINPISSFNQNAIEIGKEDSQKTEEVYTNPVHYDDLIEENETACKFCGKEFPNRFEAIKHEPKHWNLKKFRHTVCGFCERYIAGNYHTLRKHVENEHPGKNNRKFNLHKCKLCQLSYFSYNKHYELHHAIFKCQICYKGFQKKMELENHQCDEKHKWHMEKCNRQEGIKPSATMKLCDMCYTFMKSYMQKRHNYVLLGELSEIGVRQVCDKCNCKFFVVKLVKRESLVKEPFKHRKALSNVDRLKRMQCRLKMLQSRNKF